MAQAGQGLARCSAQRLGRSARGQLQLGGIAARAQGLANQYNAGERQTEQKQQGGEHQNNYPHGDSPVALEADGALSVSSLFCIATGA